MTNLDSILKSRDITLSTKVHLVKAMVFPVVMYGCASWTIKKAENWRTDAFALWYWRRLLRVPWTARRSNQSILKEISPGCSLAGLMLKLKCQYFGHLIQRADSFEKALTLGKIEGRRRRDHRGRDGWMISLTQCTWVWVNSGSWWWTGRSGMLQSMVSQRVRQDWVSEQQVAPVQRTPSVQFSRSVMSDSLQHTRPPCPSPTSRAYSNSCPLSRWCHSTISSTVISFSSCPQSFPASGSFPVSQLFVSGGQSIGVSASTSVFPMNTQDWFPLGLTGLIFLQSKGLSRVFSNTTVQKHQFFGVQLSLYSNSHIHTWLLKKP